MRLQMATVERSENLVQSVSFEIAKSETERWHKGSNVVLENPYKVQSDLNFIQRLHTQDHSQNWVL